MKKLFTWNCSGMLPDLSEYFELVGAERYKESDAMILWTDTYETPQLFIIYAKHKGIPTFVIQHGARTEVNGKEYINEEVLQKLADFYLVWANGNNKYMRDVGWKPEEVINIGSTIFQHRPKYEPVKNRVGFAPVHPALHWMNMQSEHLCLPIWERLKKMSDIQPTVKLVAEQDNMMAEIYKGEQFITDRVDQMDEQHQTHIIETYKWLSNLSLLVVCNNGSIVTMALSMGIPVLKVGNFINDEAFLKGAIQCSTGERCMENIVTGVLDGRIIPQYEAMDNYLNKYAPYNPNPAKTIAGIVNQKVSEYEISNNHALLRS